MGGTAKYEVLSCSFQKQQNQDKQIFAFSVFIPKENFNCYVYAELHYA